VRDDKRGAIAEDLPPILERIGTTRAAWLQLAKDFETHFWSWRPSRACRAGLRARGPALGARYLRLPPAVFQLSALSSP